MAVEVEVFAHQQPNRLLVCRLGGWVMRSVLGVGDVAAVITEDGSDVWRVRWGTSVSVQVVELPPGQYEFVDLWTVSVSPYERGVDLGKVFAMAIADAAAVLADGFIRDEGGMAGGGDIPAGRSIARLLRCPSQDEAAILEFLKRT
ncbi:hypothetical protein [Kribbella speibonae]|uniref:Uncharacterized protein n=1 Tax=Kribbella speibonae TaxID=1572660 RepID=A0A4R0ID29_9ACTN|nr:hypothetical protein [Kribbella speibonae]TCC22820.1 hypothetical protein E0H58_20805 [Kribbella speibonae]TCC30309.1 hypothetical protein E0H92_40865 [Kribbella speibonae]